MTTESLSGRAAKLARLVDDVASPHLEESRSVIIAVRVNLQGLVASTAASALGGAAGRLVNDDSTLAAASDEAEGAGFPTDAQQAIGLIADALVVVSRSSLSGKPKTFRAAIPLSAVESVRFERGRMGDTLRFEMVSGARADFVCVKVDPGEQFAAAVDQRLRPRKTG